MIVTIDAAALMVICIFVAIVAFAIGLVVARGEQDEDKLRRLIERLEEMVLVPHPLNSIVEAVGMEIQRNLPTEEKFRETVAAMIKVAKVGEAVEKASRGRKRI